MQSQLRAIVRCVCACFFPPSLLGFDFMTSLFSPGCVCVSPSKLWIWEGDSHTPLCVSWNLCWNICEKENPVGADIHGRSSAGHFPAGMRLQHFVKWLVIICLLLNCPTDWMTRARKKAEPAGVYPGSRWQVTIRSLAEKKSLVSANL